MSKESSGIKEQLNNLQKERQKQLMQSFMIYFATAAISSIIVSFVREYDSLSRHLIELTAALLIVGVFALSIYIVYKMTRGHEAFDTAVLIMVLIYYGFAMLFSTENMVLAATIYFPMYIFLVFSTMSKLRMSIFVGIHGMIVIYNFITRPNYTYRMNEVNYLTIVLVTGTVLIIAYRLIMLYNFYMKDLSEGYKTLSDNNLELTALNEEYIATQEELFNKLDEVKELNEANERLAYYDSLTGIYNRNGFMRRLKTFSDKKDRESYIVYADIERFKDINSVYGYKIGDEIIRYISQKIKTLPVKVDLAARIAGDLFAIIVNGHYDETELVKALDGIAGDVVLDEFTISLRLNYGVLPLLNKPLSEKEIIQAVDVALNKAKEMSNRHHFFYDERMGEDIEKRVVLTQALEKAITGKGIYTVYQGVVDADTGITVAYETLARWEDETIGSISPAMFIPLAEQTGLINPLGDVVLEGMLEFVKQLQGIGKNIITTLNVSSRQLLMGDFDQHLLEVLDREGIDCKTIGVEVTETDLIDNFDMAVKQLQVLRQRGIRVYLDDFGTGYSSLSYLSKLPIDVLKIDRVFITDIHKDVSRQPTLRAIVALAKECELKTVAEGVETIEEYEYLKKMGIHMIQGFYFSKPEKPENIEL